MGSLRRWGSALLWPFLRGQGWRILMYHRVIESCDIPIEPGMYVKPETFRLQAEYLAEHCEVIGLDELLANLNDLPPRSVAITFDDGWEDTYRVAYPILKEFNLPATVFLPTAFIDKTQLFWTDELAVYLKANTEEYGRLILKRCSSQCENFTLDTCLAELKRVGAQKRDSILDEVRRLEPIKEVPRQFLSWSEVREMKELSFGSHTHSHKYLNELSVDEINSEYNNSMQILDSEVPEQVTKAFCYPGGQFCAHSQDVLMNLGVEHSLTTDRKLTPFSKPLLLPRVGIHEDISYTLPMFHTRVWA